MLSMRRVVYVASLAAVLFGSFFITLWLTEPEPATSPPIAADNRSDTERLAAHRILNYSELSKAAQNVGLRLSRQLKGNADVISRINEREVSMAGWLVDPEGDSTPLNILVFIEGAMIAAAQTKGERPDVTRAIHLGFGSEKNVSFSVNFNCHPGDQPIVVGIGNGKQYIPLRSAKCP